MDNDLISRSALLEKAYLTEPATMNNPYGGDYVVKVEDIEAAPTIDPESLRPTGRWYSSSVRPDTLICSECGYGEDMWWADKGTDYCPNCGAKMMEE